jgi:ELWxxDGT repeat protein
VSLGDRLVLFARDAHGWEPWATDGTLDGTALLRDVRPGQAGGIPEGFHEEPIVLMAQQGLRAVFVAQDGIHGFELWSTDGTPEGTDMVADIGPGSSVDSSRLNLVTASSGLLFFVADDGVHGMELWALPPFTGLWASFSVAPAGCQRGRRVSLDASASTAPDGARIVRYRWDLGDGTVLEGPEVGHEYSESVFGRQKICLTVTDDLGGSHTTCREFCIEDPFRFLRADCSGDGETGGVTDAIFLLSYSFLGGEEPPCLAACDSNGDGKTGGVTDAIYLLGYNFLGTPPPPEPFPACGPPEVATDEALGCERPPPGCQ